LKRARHRASRRFLNDGARSSLPQYRQTSFCVDFVRADLPGRRTSFSSALRHSPGLSGLHPCLPVAVPIARASGAWRLSDSRWFRSPFCSALHQLGFQGPALSGWLLRPRLTSRAAFRRRPFRRQARSPQVRLRDLPRTTAGIYAGALWPRGLRGLLPARPEPPRLLSDSCSSARGFAPRFFQRCPRGSPPCASLVLDAACSHRGFHLTSHAPCWAHQKVEGRVNPGPPIRHRIHPATAAFSGGG